MPDNCPIAHNTEVIPGLPGVVIPEIILPAEGLSLYHWAVIACDQFTAQADYWQETEKQVGQAPSTLRLVLPELYLEHPSGLSIPDRIQTINQTMARYWHDGLLRRLPPGCMLLDRRTAVHGSRKGLVLAVDLDCYDFTPGNHELIRATEGTVLDRIPPRVAIRRDALFELPHIQVLIDDSGHRVIEPLLSALQKEQPKPFYETELMQDGGSLRAWFAPAGSPLLQEAFQAMAGLGSLKSHGLLMAVGDGNHSLATAKAHWQNMRAVYGPDHPARYALVEVINLHDQGLAFEPIHRTIANLSPGQFLEQARRYFKDQDFQVLPADGIPDTASSSTASAHRIPMLTAEGRCGLYIGKPRQPLAAGAIQDFLDDLVQAAPARIDYIHGDDVVARLAAEGQIGLLLPAMKKQELFPSLIRDGVLPRKTFSLGEAREKRYYMECRQIR